MPMPALLNIKPLKATGDIMTTKLYILRRFEMTAICLSVIYNYIEK